MDILSDLTLKAYVRGTLLTVIQAELGEFLGIQVLDAFDYPVSSATQETINCDLVATTICGKDTR